jgi:DNA-binding protein H-NS
VLKKAAELHAKALKEKQLSVAKGALDIIGKHVDVQAFREQIQHSGLIEYKNLSDEEIAARIAAHEAARAAKPHNSLTGSTSPSSTSGRAARRRSARSGAA